MIHKVVTDARFGSKACRPPCFIQLAGLIIVLLATSAAGQATAADAAPDLSKTRLAIIATDRAAQPAADLLTVEFDTSFHLPLLERNEIDRVRNEQRISAGNANTVKLGQILGADGLLVTEISQAGTNRFLTARLIAVKPGVVIGYFRTPWPLVDATEWPRRVAARFGPLLPKLGLSAKDAIPISVVNFRSATAAPGSVDLERQVTTLAIERLTQIPSVLVLERRKMDLLSEEKELQNAGEAAFWSGAYLLDGVIDRDGYHKDTATINAALTPPRGGQPIAIAVSGSRANLTELVGRLGEKAATAMSLGVSPAWEPAHEAEEYFAEAKWALKWKLFEEAHNAAEASWNLGKQAKPVAELRVRAWAADADTQHLGRAITALQIYDQAFRDFLTPIKTVDRTWHSLGMRLLEQDSMLLDSLCFGPESARSDDREKLAELRAGLRVTAAILEQHPAYKSCIDNEISPIAIIAAETGQLLWTPVKNLSGMKAVMGALWCDSPEQCLELYRGFSRSGELLQVYNLLAFHRVIAWRPGDNGQREELWQGYVQELCNSASALENVAGRHLAFATAKTGKDLQECGDAYFRAALTNANQIVAAKMEERFFKNTENLLAAMPTNPDAKSAREKLHDYYYFNDFRCEFARIALVHYLETDEEFVPGELGRIGGLMNNGGGGKFLHSPERVREVLAAMDNYRARIKKRQEQKPFDYGFQNAFDTHHAWLMNGLTPEERAKAGPSKPVTTARNPATTEGNIRNAASTAPIANTTFPTNVIRATRLWEMPAEVDFQSNSMGGGIHITGGKTRADKFWIEVVCGHNGRLVRKAFLFGIDPAGLQTETVTLPLAGSVTDSYNGEVHATATGDSFEVLGQWIYLNLGGKIKRYSRESKMWEDLQIPLPEQSHIRLTTIGDQLFILTDDSILRWKSDSGTTDLLASTRRRPAANKLDALESFASNIGERLALFGGPDQSLRAYFGGVFYSSTKAGAEWTELKTIPIPTPRQLGFIGVYDRGAVAAVTGPEQETRWYLLPTEQAAPELVLVEPKARPNFGAPGAAGSPFGPEPRLPDNPGKPRWTHLEQTPLPRNAAYDGTNLWSFGNRVALRNDTRLGVIPIEQNGSHTSFVECRKDVAQPQVIPVWLQWKQGLLPPEWPAIMRAQGGFQPGSFLSPTLFVPTPSAMVVGFDNVPGLWFIPWTEMNGTATATDENGKLFEAIEAGNLAGAASELDRGAGVNARNFRGWTPLMLAARAGNLEMAKLLIERGADLKAKSSGGPGSTVLGFGIEGNSPDVIKLLLSKGAPVNEPSKTGLTPLYKAIVDKKPMVVNLLVASGADVNQPGGLDDRGTEFTPLMGAAMAENIELMELLLGKGATLDKKNNKGDTALMTLAKTDHPKVLKHLITKGANVNAAGPRGHTALIYAAFNGRTENVHLLLDAGADPAARAWDGDSPNAPRYTAEDVARQQDKPEALALIQAAKKKASGAGQ